MYTAKLSRNLRDVETGAPKALLTQLELDGKPFRDGHCHVALTEVESIRPREGFYALIKFEAEQVPYIKRGTEEGTTLANIAITSVKYIKHKAKKSYKPNTTKRLMKIFDQIS